jgi:S1-C subfamily serine protease
VGVLRGGKETRLSIALETAPENPPRDAVRIRARSPLGGATVANLSPAVAEEMRVDSHLQGVVITAVDEGTAAQAVGLRAGDIVLEINGEKVARSRELEGLMQTPQRVWRLQIMRGGQIMTTVVGG